jgi:hypothetical protein
MDHTTGQVPKDHTVLRSISALIASLPASENKGFREEFDTVSLALVVSLCLSLCLDLDAPHHSDTA